MLDLTTLLLITGAGASCGLGYENAPSPPLMGGWARDLCDRLGPHAELLGLHRNMKPEDFEATLGRFLALERNLDSVAAYPRAGIAPSAGAALEGQVEDWFRQARSTTAEIIAAVFSSLHELFALTRFSALAAEWAYGALLENLQPERLTYATTNYDVAGELALEALGRRPYAGLDAALTGGHTQRLHYDDITHDDVRRTPVLHLHGRVGWYYAPDGQAIAASPDSPYNGDLGSPALLLPDPNKAYEDALTQSIWNQFSTAIGQSTRVLVVGHSLNDTQLRHALHQVEDAHLGITIQASEGDERDAWESAADELMSSLGRSPHIIPMHFGPEPCADAERFRRFADGEGPAQNTSSSVKKLPRSPR